MNQNAHPAHNTTWHGLYGDVTTDLPAGATHYERNTQHNEWRDAAKARGLTLEFGTVWGAGFWYAKDAAGKTVGKWTCDSVAGHGYLMNEET